MNKGIMTSEFWLSILASAICGGAYALGHPLDFMSVLGLFGMVSVYTGARWSAKKTHAEALAAAVSSNPQYVNDTKNMVESIVKPVLTAYEKDHPIVVALIRAKLNSEIAKLNQ